MKAVPSLSRVEFRVFSQWGEDGIIDWLIEQAGIPAHLQTFVEIGIESYIEANTRFLLENRNWRGLVIDGNPEHIRLLQRRDGYLFWRYDLTARSAFVTRENINDLVLESGFCGEIGLLSIDIDGNDYWVWDAISVLRPIICVCEYNAVLGDIWPLSVPYDPEFVRTRPEFGNLYYGSSVVALKSLSKRKGYRFVGANSEGINAFFVREDYASKFGSLQHPVAQPSRLRESRDSLGALSYLAGTERCRLLRDLPVVNTETLASQPLGSFEPLYTEEWLTIMNSAVGPRIKPVGCSQ
jgi:hypothetical protein